MTKEDFAELLDGRSYMKEISPLESIQAGQLGLIVIFGYSDDNVELRGALDEEVGMYGGGTIHITSDGKLARDWDSIDHDDIDACREFFRIDGLPTAEIACQFSPPDDAVTWRYKTDLPHASFNVMEDDEIFCRGIVISLVDIQP